MVNGRQEHVAIAERALGKPLPLGVQVHHFSENGRDNRNQNLVICPDARYHKLLHVRVRVVRAGGDPNTMRVCSLCQQPKVFGEFYSRDNAKYPCEEYSSACKPCGRTAALANQAKRREQQKAHAAPEQETVGA